MHTTRFARGLSAVAALLLVGCGATTAVAPTAAPPSLPPPTVAAPTVAATTAPTVAPPTVAAPTVAFTATTALTATTAATAPPVDGTTFQNPVFRANFPDPFVLKVGSSYYGYATNGSSHNIQLATSPDLVHWQLGGDAMPSLARWAKLGGSLVWAPEVIPVGDKYVMYYTARDKASNKQCIGVATSAKPEGKFKDTSDTPIVCQPKEGGSIDPSPFRDGDTLYLYWKSDGNCCSLATYLYVQQLAPDGLSLVGEPTKLVRNDRAWEGRVVEAPTMVKHGDRYFLFFSANDYAGLDYAVGYATCDAPTGPCTDAPENPILKTVTAPALVAGPGHQTVLQVGEQTWIVYHVWEVSAAGMRTDRRFVYLDRIAWQDDKPDVQGPTTAPQPVP